MIILDTNVVSEPLKPAGDPRVAAWIDRQRIDSLYLTAVNVSELLLGVELLPIGQRRSRLDARIGDIINVFGPARILPFGMTAARHFAVLISRARAAGYATQVADGQIAAIAAAHGFAVATRDTTPFVAAGIAVINPWEEA